MATQAELTRRIERIKAALAALGDLRPGTLSEQYNTCRTPGCRCKADPPQRHGPYHQLSYSRRGRSHTENVPPADLAAVQAQLRNYQKFRDLIDEWVDTAIELDRLRRARKQSPTGRAPAATARSPQQRRPLHLDHPKTTGNSR